MNDVLREYMIEQAEIHFELIEAMIPEDIGEDAKRVIRLVFLSGFEIGFQTKAEKIVGMK